MKTFEMTAEISPTHEIHLKLPDSVAAGTARVVVYCEESSAQRRTQLNAFLTQLMESASPGLTHAQIQARMDIERNNWDD
ncbi:MAG: hypothetical protein RL095_1350 [Verrucomicrobiota bacterium]|jgi:hypothetical protein